MDNNKKEIENRKYTRFPVINKYTLLLDGQRHQGVIGNISLGGAYLSSISPSITKEHLFKKGKITMDLSGIELLLSCKICFVETESDVIDNSAGIAFTSASEVSIMILTDYIELIQKND